MARSKFGEQQIKDIDVLTESEHESTAHYFEDLIDTTTLSGNCGKYIRVDENSNVLVYGPISTLTSGIELIADVDFNNRKVKKAYINIEDGIITSYSGGEWEDYSDFYFYLDQS